MKIITESMIKLAEDRAKLLAKDTQAHGVVVLVWHSDEELALGYAIDKDRNENFELLRMLKDAVIGVEKRQ